MTPSAAAEQPAVLPHEWPGVELKRNPINGLMSVAIEFPIAGTPLGAQLGLDALLFTIEPQRALTFRNKLTDMLAVLGLQ